MKRLTTTLALLAAALYASAQEATLPTPDAKALGMGGVAMTTLSGSHAIYNNSATAIFSQMPSQVSSSYYGQGEFDYYAVTGFCRFDNVNMAQIGWRQYLRERGNNDMAVDLGYSRRLGERWAVGIVGRYMHLKRHDDTADALAVDLSAAWSLPLENVGSYSTLRVGGKLGNLGRKDLMLFATEIATPPWTTPSLSVEVNQAALGGDPYALDILKDAAKCTSTLADEVIRLLHLDEEEELRVGVWGSALVKSKLHLQYFTENVKAKYPAAKIILPEKDACDGACMMALANARS